MEKSFSLTNHRKVVIHDNRIDFYSGNWFLFSFPVSSQIGVLDADTSVRFEDYSETQEGSIFVWSATSSQWKKKYYVFVCDSYLTYKIDIEGKGAPDSILYFRGDESQRGISYAVSGYLVPQFQDVDEYRAESLVGTEGMVFPLRAAPPPFVLPFWNDYNTDWIGVGVAAPAGENNYERFIVKYHGSNCSWFELPLLGYTKIDGHWTSPTIWIGFGKTNMDVIHNYAEWTYQEMKHPRHPGSANAPSWWKKPILCGWGEQCVRCGEQGHTPIDLARQSFYEEMEERVDRVGLKPGIIMIDDKWQKDYGTLEVDTEKWPNLREFVDRQHTKGRHVVLWFRQWIAEGLPGDECTKQRRLICTTDPTNPKYLAHLKKQIHYLLSSDEGCMNCDGFKLDFMDCLPRTVPGVETYEPGVYGLEMMRRLFAAVYKYSKEVKSDALINTSAIHPYFADICDQIRLHDFVGSTRATVSMMRFRAAITRAVMPDVLIDTDHAHTDIPQEGLYKILHNAECGIPVLYSLAPFTDEQLSEIQDSWDSYCHEQNIK